MTRLETKRTLYLKWLFITLDVCILFERNCKWLTEHYLKLNKAFWCVTTNFYQYKIVTFCNLNNYIVERSVSLCSCSCDNCRQAVTNSSFHLPYICDELFMLISNPLNNHFKTLIWKMCRHLVKISTHYAGNTGICSEQMSSQQIPVVFQ